MILPMKRASLIVLDSQRAESLRELRRLGLLHLRQAPGSSAALAGLLDQKATLERALAALPLDTPKGAAPPARGAAAAAHRAGADLEGDLQRAREAVQVSEKLRELGDALDRLRREQERLEPWGEFEPADIGTLRDSGVSVSLHALSDRELDELPQSGARWFRLARARGLTRVAVVQTARESREAGEAAPLPAELPLPELGLRQLGEKRRQLESAVAEQQQRLVQIASERPRLGAALQAVQREIVFEQTRAGMGCEGPVAYLVGYVPAKRSGRLAEAARKNGWGLLLEEPGLEETVPTCIENPRWVNIIEPVFGFLGTVPGYREVDISFWFLIFFSVFFAMLIGDAGYGAIMLGLTALARLRLPRARGRFTTLMLVLSLTTIVWGVLTGTYFGVEALARNPLLSRAVVPAIASFGYDNANTVMLICFVIGLVHLTLAHTISFLRLVPSIRALNDLGWIAVLWGMFSVVRLMILKQPLHPSAPWLIGGGLLAVTVAGEQQGRFFKGLLVGLAKLPLKLLNSISAFADIVSYVRLFAVGLASVEIAKAFNEMAAGIGFGIPSGVFAALILFLGHALNIVMGALSVVVHGVRLNMLEFSGHLGMEWTGVAYEPFGEPSGQPQAGD